MTLYTRQVIVIIKLTTGGFMKYSTKLSDAIHILSFIALHPDMPLTSSCIAESIKTNPAFVRQLMSSMKKKDIIITTKGHPKPILSKSPSMITLLDVYLAVEGDKPLLHLDTHINQECGVGVNIQLALGEYYKQLQSSIEIEMKSITLQQILNTYQDKLRHLQIKED